jgi:hypothetical protein
MKLREPTASELKLIKYLFFLSPEAMKSLSSILSTLKVLSMDDGGMGSLRLFPRAVEVSDTRLFGEAVSKCYFDDTDDVRVIATLYVDQNGSPLEIDIWKTNFEKLIEIPDTTDFNGW